MHSRNRIGLALKYDDWSEFEAFALANDDFWQAKRGVKVFRKDGPGKGSPGQPRIDIPDYRQCFRCRKWWPIENYSLTIPVWRVPRNRSTTCKACRSASASRTYQERRRFQLAGYGEALMY